MADIKKQGSGYIITSKSSSFRVSGVNLWIVTEMIERGAREVRRRMQWSWRMIRRRLF